PHMQKFASSFLSQAKYSQDDQALADIALYACDKCLKIDGLSVSQREHIGSACDHLRDAGATPMPEAHVDAADDGLVRAASRLEQQPSDFRSGDNASGDALKTLRRIARASDSRNRAHRNLMDVAHECVEKLTDRVACAPPASLSDTGERHSG